MTNGERQKKKMGALWSQVGNAVFPRGKSRVLLLGLRHSGKTRLLRCISKSNHVQSAALGIGSVCRYVETQAIAVYAIDINPDNHWRVFFRFPHKAVIWMVSGDRVDADVSSTLRALQQLVADREGSPPAAPWLVLVNRQGPDDNMQPIIGGTNGRVAGCAHTCRKRLPLSHYLHSAW